MKRLASLISGLVAGVGMAVVWRRRRREDGPRTGPLPAIGRNRLGQGDSALAERVREQLFGADASSIAVAVHRGAVTLRGEVDELADIATLDARARGVEGVADVTNLLRLRSRVAV